MYKIILVDDERPILDMMENYIDWGKMSAYIVATAHNGQNALNKIESLQPDIVFTDVKMPVMDGIELCKQVHTRFPEIQIIFLSGYNEFEYACAALQYGACGYLLKPIDPDEVAEIMKKACQRREEQKDLQNSLLSTANEYMRELLQLGGRLLPGLSNEVVSIYNRHLGLSPDNDKFDFVFITIDEYSLLSMETRDADAGFEEFSTVERLELFIAGLPNDFRGVLSKLRDGQWLFITSSANCADYKEWRNRNSEAQRWISLFFTSKPQPLSAFTMRFSELLSIRKQMVFAFGTGLITEIWEKNQIHYDCHPLPSTEHLIAAIQQNRRDKVENWLDEFYDSALIGGAINQAISETLSVFESIFSGVAANNRYLQNSIEQDAQFLDRLSHMESLQSIKLLMHQFLSMVLDALEAPIPEHHIEIVRQICSIVQLEYNQALSLDTLAERVFLSPNYLSTIFKENTGKTLVEYITEVRMKNACRMLSETNVKVHEIARCVGYESPSYFGSVFLKRTGLTPNQYRVRAQRSAKP